MRGCTSMVCDVVSWGGHESQRQGSRARGVVMSGCGYSYLAVILCVCVCVYRQCVQCGECVHVISVGGVVYGGWA